MSVSDIEYIQRTLDGDTGAFEALVNRYKNMVFSIIWRIIGHEKEAEEIAQDVFLKAYRSLERFEQKGKFSNWLYKIAWNMAISHRRKRKLSLQPIDAVNETSMLEGELDNEAFRILQGEEQQYYIHQALQSLSYQENTLMTLYYLNEKSVEEIVEISQLSRSNVKVILFRARKKMYGALASLMGGELNSLL